MSLNERDEVAGRLLELASKIGKAGPGDWVEQCRRFTDTALPRMTPEDRFILEGKLAAARSDSTFVCATCYCLLDAGMSEKEIEGVIRLLFSK